MKLLAHFLAADMRRFRLTIAVWVAIVAAATILEGMTPLVAGQPRAATTVALAATLVWLARVLFLVALVPLIVQTHPLVGSDAFWMTRPIPPRTLLLSKLILLSSLLVIVPLVCDLAFMAFHRVPPGQMTLVALQISLVRSLVLVILMAAAAITVNLARYALLGGAVLLLLAVVVSVVTWIALSRIDEMPMMAVVAIDHSSYVEVSRGADQTPALAGSLVFLAAWLALLAVQYRRRSVTRSVFVGIAGTVLAWLVASAWPWPLIHQRLVVPDWANSASALRLSADPLSVVLEPIDVGWSERPRIWRAATANVRLSDVAPDWFATARLASASLELDRDVRVVSRSSGHIGALPADEDNEAPLYRALRNVLGVRVILGSAPLQNRAEAAVMFVVRDDELARYRDLTRDRNALGTYRGQFQVDLRRLGIAATLPMEPGAAFQENAYRATIKEIRKGLHELTIRITSSQASTMFDRRPQPEYSFYLRNRQLGEAATGLLMPVRGYDLFPFFSFPVFYAASSPSGFVAAASLIRFPASYGLPNLPRKVQLDDAWLLGAELVIVRTTAEGSVPRTLEIDGFQLSERPPEK